MAPASSVLVAFAVVGVLVTAAILAAALALGRVLRLPDDNPRKVVARRKASAPRKRTIAFVGASIIHGRVSANLPERVRALLGSGADDVELVNAGVNGDLAYNALTRADDVLACAPTDVIVLVGSNDVMASLSARDARRYRLGKRLPREPDLAFYRSSLDALLVKLTEAGARVAVCTLPMLGEAPASPFNERVRIYNDVVRELACHHDLALLDVNTALWGESERRGAGRSEPLLGARMLLPMLLRGSGASFEAIGKQFGFRVLSDGVHLTERAADRVAELMAAFLRGQEPDGP